MRKSSISLPRNLISIGSCLLSSVMPWISEKVTWSPSCKPCLSSSEQVTTPGLPWRKQSKTWRTENIPYQLMCPVSFCKKTHVCNRHFCVMICYYEFWSLQMHLHEFERAQLKHFLKATWPYLGDVNYHSWKWLLPIWISHLKLVSKVTEKLAAMKHKAIESMERWV